VVKEAFTPAPAPVPPGPWCAAVFAV